MNLAFKFIHCGLNMASVLVTISLNHSQCFMAAWPLADQLLPEPIATLPYDAKYGKLSLLGLSPALSTVRRHHVQRTHPCRPPSPEQRRRKINRKEIPWPEWFIQGNSGHSGSPLLLNFFLKNTRFNQNFATTFLQILNLITNRLTGKNFFHKLNIKIWIGKKQWNCLKKSTPLLKK